MITEITGTIAGALAIYGIITMTLNDRATILIGRKRVAIGKLLHGEYELVGYYGHDCAPCEVTFSIQKIGEGFKYGLPSRKVYRLIKSRKIDKLYKLCVAKQEKMELARKKSRAI